MYRKELTIASQGDITVQVLGGRGRGVRGFWGCFGGVFVLVLWGKVCVGVTVQILGGEEGVLGCVLGIEGGCVEVRRCYC